MSTKLTDMGSMVMVQTVVSFGGKSARALRGVLVPIGDKKARKTEMVRQADAIRARKGFEVGPKEPTD